MATQLQVIQSRFISGKYATTHILFSAYLRMHPASQTFLPRGRLWWVSPRIDIDDRYWTPIYKIWLSETMEHRILTKMHLNWL